MEIIALDAHKRYSQVCVQKKNGQFHCEKRINHSKGQIGQFLARWTAGSPVALETVGNWYWIVDEIEQADMKPKLVRAHKAKLMLGSVNKTDKLDARGLNKLQRPGTLPCVWIPPGGIRDQRELPRTRMVFANLRTRLKNRIHTVFDKYSLHTDFDGISDIFGGRGREQMALTIKQLPSETRYTLRSLLRDDVLNRELFYSVKEAKVIVESWRLEYNNHRPHSSLGYMTPSAFAASCNPPGSAAPGGLQDKEHG